MKLQETIAIELTTTLTQLKMPADTVIFAEQAEYYIGRSQSVDAIVANVFCENFPNWLNIDDQINDAIEDCIQRVKIARLEEQFS